MRFDTLRIEQELRGIAAYAKQRELLERLRAEYPRVQQLQGVEISFDTPHLNEFSIGTELLDYDRIAREGG